MLAHLHRGPQAVGELQQASGLKRSTLTNVLDRLEARGFVERRPNPDDRRSSLVALTRSGRSTAAQVAATIRKLERAVHRRVSARDVEGLRAVAAALAEISRV